MVFFERASLCVAVVVSAAVVACGDSSGPAGASDAGSSVATLTVTSTSFTNGSAIPRKHATTYVDGGQNKSIPLAWSGAPATTQTFAIAVIDTDPSALNFMHWMVVNIPVTTTSLAESAADGGMVSGAVQHKNDFMTMGYGGMGPPQGETHNYVTTIYALNGSVDAGNPTTYISYSTFQSRISSKIVGQGSLTGTFQQ